MDPSENRWVRQTKQGKRHICRIRNDCLCRLAKYDPMLRYKICVYFGHNVKAKHQLKKINLPSIMKMYLNESIAY